LRSRFDPSIELVSRLVRVNPMGKTPGVLRARDELGQAVVFGSVTSSELGQLGQPVAFWAAHGGVSSSRFMGCAQGRDPASVWGGEEVSAPAKRKNETGCLFFKSFLNSKPI
jgi:hypothetical protein